jgi:hypothetical protein
MKFFLIILDTKIEVQNGSPQAITTRSYVIAPTISCLTASCLERKKAKEARVLAFASKRYPEHPAYSTMNTSINRKRKSRKASKSKVSKNKENIEN